MLLNIILVTTVKWFIVDIMPIIYGFIFIYSINFINDNIYYDFYE